MRKNANINVKEDCTILIVSTEIYDLLALFDNKKAQHLLADNLNGNICS